jgi:hypothetical protein
MRVMALTLADCTNPARDDGREPIALTRACMLRTIARHSFICLRVLAIFMKVATLKNFSSSRKPAQQSGLVARPLDRHLTRGLGFELVALKEQALAVLGHPVNGGLQP